MTIATLPAGIWRIEIESSWKDDRTELSRRMAPQLDAIYREVFSGLGRPLRPETRVETCTKEDAVSRYDWGDGIDRKLIEQSGRIITVQDKVLTWHQNTVTFEEKKTSGALGFWYYGTPQLYSVFYFRNGSSECSNWIILNMEQVRQYESRIAWRFNRNNGWGGRRAEFRFAYFDQFPPECVVASKYAQYELWINPLFMEHRKRAS